MLTEERCKGHSDSVIHVVGECLVVLRRKEGRPLKSWHEYECLES